MTYYARTHMLVLSFTRNLLVSNSTFQNSITLLKVLIAKLPFPLYNLHQTTNMMVPYHTPQLNCQLKKHSTIKNSRSINDEEYHPIAVNHTLFRTTVMSRKKTYFYATVF